MITPVLASKISYSGTSGLASWEGRHVDDVMQFKGFVRRIVRPRVADDASLFEPDILGLATTGMETEFIERLITTVPEPEGWEIGEAFAECALQNDCGREIHWPWNPVRDRRTPRASLPGADLVGFYREGNSVVLLFGEVKTSSELRTPPNVMYGGSGMIWQLEENLKRLDIQLSLLKWLYTRCKTEPYRTLYKKAVSCYLKSKGKELLIVGVLVRDTQPDEADLQSRATTLSNVLEAPTRAQLIAWYLPVPIADWPKLLRQEVI
jgi:hypothetical protein